MNLSDFFQQSYFGNTTLDYGLAIATVCSGVVLAPIASAIVRRGLRRALSQSLDDLIVPITKIVSNAVNLFVWLAVLRLASTRLELHPILNDGIASIATIVTTWIGIRLVYNTIDCGLRYYVMRRSDESLDQMLLAIRPLIRIVVWSIGLVFVIDNLGFDVSAAIASLGIGGLALALASQGILQDLFSYASIICDRPFEIGDFVVLGDDAGTIEHIGIKTTRINRLSGEQLIISNTELVSARVRNFKQMESRRIVFGIGVIYETDRQKLAEIPAIIRQIIEPIDDVIFERAHFLNMGDFSLNYEIVYHVQTSDYLRYTDIQQEINLKLMDVFAEHGIEFAYPTQVLQLQAGENTADVAQAFNSSAM